MFVEMFGRQNSVGGKVSVEILPLGDDSDKSIEDRLADNDDS